MDALLSDIRFGARMLWKTRGITLIAMLSLAAGIGANTAIFSVVNSVLLRSRPFAQPDQLVHLYVGDREEPYHTTSYPSFVDFRGNNGVFSDLAAYGVGWQFRIGGSEVSDVEQVWGEVVSGNYFDVLGVRLALGRGFLAEEDSVPGRNPVVVISHGLWQRRFASDPQLPGKEITINNQRLTVVGVAPARYTGMISGWSTDVWVPAMVSPLLDPSRGERMLTHRGNKWVTLVGRMKPGVELDQVRSRFAVLSNQMQAAHPEEWASRRDDGTRRTSFVTVVPEAASRVHPGMRAPAYAVAALLFVVVDLVLVIACLNLASILFARAVARRNEVAVRLAMGASRWRIVRQLLTESVMLSLAAGAIGAIAGIWGLRVLVASIPALPEGIRLAVDIAVDWRVLLYSSAFAMVTGLLFGLAPALHAARSSLSAVLKDEGVTARFRKSRVRAALIVGQVAGALLLLIAAGLVIRSLDNVQPTRLGFSTDRVLVAALDLDDTRYDRATSQQLYESLQADVSTMPGVVSVSLIDAMPGGFIGRSRRGTGIEGHATRPGEFTEIDAAVVGPGYFVNMGVPIVAGRDFAQSDRDGAPCVAIVNHVFARTYFRDVNAAIGKRLDQTPGGGERRLCEVVGVVRDDAWQALNAEARPFFFLSALQSDERRMTMLIHTTVEPHELTASVAAALRRLDPSIPVSGITSLQEFFSVAAYPFKLLAIVMASCGIAALLLAIVGIYGTIAFSVAQRRREMGIRIALGAARSDILALVVGQGMRLVGYGLVAGVMLGIALTWVLTSMPLETSLLFGVSATDIATFVVVTLFLGAVALLACYVPARRAAGDDPMDVLRRA